VVVASSAVPPIGARLRAERRRRGVSVRGLAREIGVSASLISQIETEKSSPSVSTLYAITTALGISIEELFGPATAGDDADPADATEGEDSLPALAAAGDQVVHDGPAADALLTAALAAAGTAVHLGGPTNQPSGGPTNHLRGGPGPGAAPGGAVPGERVGPVVTPDDRELLTLDSGVTWELLGRMPHKHVEFLLITYEPGGTSSSTGRLMRHSGTEFGFVISGELTLSLGFETHKLRAGDAVSFDSSNPHAYRNESTEPAVGVWFVLERWA
jgi:transcriptional regulator with XRE-family HTH domain/quercetin dioxygenase-like cupin family protein